MFAHYADLVRTVRTITAELGRDGKGKILFAVAAGWFLSIGIRFAFPSLLPFFRAEFDFGLTLAGVLLSALWFAYAIGQFPGGLLGDRLGEGNILVISTAVSVGAVLVVATAVNLWMLFLGTIAFGLATALYGPTRFTIFTDIYEDRAGTAVGLSHATGSIGNTVLPAMAAGIASYTTWRAGFGVVLPAFVGVTIALWLWVPASTSSTQQSAAPGVARLLRRIASRITSGAMPTLVTVQVLLVFISQGFLGFYPTYLIEIKGVSPTVAATLFGIYFGVGVLIQPLTGLGNDRIGPQITLTVLVGLYFVGLIGLYFAQTILHVLVLTLFLSHRNGTGVVTNTFVAEALGDDIKGSGLGLLRTGWMMIGATSPLVIGYVGDVSNLTVGFLILAALAGLTMVLTVLIPDPS